MNRLHKIIVFIAISLVTTIGIAQEESDWASWSSVGFEYEPTKDWDFGVEANYRLKEDISVLDEYFGEFMVGRRLFKGFKIRLGLRRIWENDNRGNIQGIESHFRYNFDALYQIKPGDFEIKFRTRYQNKNELGVDDEHVQRIRFKTGLEYNIDNWKLDPEITGELLARVFDEDGDNPLKYRLKFGTAYKIKNGGRFNLYYAIQRDFEKVDRETLHIIVFKYSYTLERK